MGEFFRGWRRKAGCVALVMACVVFAGWMRSRAYDFGFESDLYLKSSQGSLEWSTYSEFVEEHTPQPLRWFHKLHTGTSGMQFGARTIWRYKLAGFVVYSRHVVDFDGNPMYRVDSWIVPYWGILVPLTLLSAYLILWKPR